jgi:hypothetical protein
MIVSLGFEGISHHCINLFLEIKQTHAPLELTILQDSNWPIVLAKEMLYECVIHGTPVISDEVLYIG